jgi:hypothetical protein
VVPTKGSLRYHSYCYSNGRFNYFIQMLTRIEANKELRKRGYKKNDEPGVWISPEGDKLAWYIAMRREDIKFDSKTWGTQMALIKEKWKEKKHLAKLKK